MKLESRLPLIKERKEQILLELGSEVTSPELYAQNVESWNRKINHKERKWGSQEIICGSTTDNLIYQATYLTDFLGVFLGNNRQEKFDMYIGVIWMLTDPPSLGDRDVENLINLFGKSREMSEKLKILNDRYEILEWIAIK